MRAIRHDGQRVWLDMGAAVPAPASGWVLLKPIRVAVGRAEAAIARSSVVRPAHAPITLGAEFVAEVVGGGAGVEAGLRGKRVVGSPEIVCGVCEFCRGGLSGHCRERRVLGMTIDGCMADAFAYPVRNLMEVPASVHDDDAAFAWSVSRALRVAQVVGAEGKRFVTIIGDSCDAMLAGQALARTSSAVRIAGEDADRLARCERWGIKHRAIADAGRRGDQDAVVETLGSAAGLHLALEMVRPRGVVVLAAPTMDATLLAAAHEKEVSLVGVRGGSIPEALAALGRRTIDAAGLITRRYRLAEGIEAFGAARTELAVVIDP
ncbi:MAG: alcohol dehydrogenase catalytic domain-containing protein [Phycisphaerales bacterium]